MRYDRRQFLNEGTKIASALSVAPFVILKNKKPAQLITVAIMGMQNRGNSLAKVFASRDDCEVSWLCDVDTRYMEKTGKELATLQDRKPRLEQDIRRVLEDPTLDALVVAAPDHWHAPAAIMAMQAGKHVYLEKPCSHNPQEGELVVEAAKKYDRIVQMGNQRRSWSNVQACMEELHAGIIGNIYFAKGWYSNTRESIGIGKRTAVPDYLNFDLWQGPAPRRDFQDNIHPYNWHWFWDWGTGEALNNGTHFLDLMRWGMQVDYPDRVVSSGGRYHYQDDWETPDTQTINLTFAENKAMSWESRSCNGMSLYGYSAGAIFHGEGGSCIIGSGNEYKIYDNESQQSLIKEVTAGDALEHDQRNLAGPGAAYDASHVLNFLQGIREGEIQRSAIEGGHKSTLLCQLGNIAYRTGRALDIDPTNGHILNDDEAMKLWSREYEEGWEPKV